MSTKELLERAAGDIGEAAAGLDYLYRLTKHNSNVLLEKVEFLRFILNNLEKVELALTRIQEGENCEAKELLNQVEW